MQLKSILSTGLVSAVAVAIAPPVFAQPIPQASSNACIQRTAEAMVVPARDIQVTGAGPVDASKGTRTLFMRNTVTGQTAECKVNTIDAYVLSVTLAGQPTPPAQTVPQASINACIQQTAEAMVVAARDITMVSAGPANGLGERTLFMRNTVTGQTAECRVNTTSNTVLSVRLTSNPSPPPGNPSQDRPVAPTDPSARACQANIDKRIRRDFAGVQKLNFLTDTTQKFVINNAINGIRGRGQFYQRSGTWYRFDYDCQVNNRNFQVTGSSYRIIR